MHLAKTPYIEHTDLRPAIVSKGLKTFHLAAEDDDGNLLEAAACGTKLDNRAAPAGAMSKRHALRRGLTICPKCEDLELEELTALTGDEEEPTE